MSVLMNKNDKPELEDVNEDKNENNYEIESLKVVKY